jgi:hypothetical protein
VYLQRAAEARLLLSEVINSLYVTGFISLVVPVKERNANTWQHCVTRHYLHMGVAHRVKTNTKETIPKRAKVS